MRKATVHRLTGAGPLYEPEKSVIELLKDILAQARRGEIKGVGVFYVDRCDTVVSTWQTGCASANNMIAGAARLFARVNAVDMRNDG